MTFEYFVTRKYTIIIKDHYKMSVIVKLHKKARERGAGRLYF